MGYGARHPVSPAANTTRCQGRRQVVVVVDMMSEVREKILFGMISMLGVFV